MLRQDHDSGKQLPFDVLTLWHNSFDDIIARIGARAAAEVSRARFCAAGHRRRRGHRRQRSSRDASCVSTPTSLAINMNSGFDDLIQFERAAHAAQRSAATCSSRCSGPARRSSRRSKTKWDKEAKRCPRR